jgi:hypothetical protein
LVPETVAFQLLVIVSVLYFQFTVQLLIGAVVELVMRIAPVKPVFHSFDTTYWQLADAVTEMADKKMNALKNVAARRKNLDCFFCDIAAFAADLDRYICNS